MSNFHIDSSVEFDTCNLVSEELAVGSDVMDVVVFDRREYASKMTDDSSLAA